jgi:hypothetical protein
MKPVIPDYDWIIFGGRVSSNDPLKCSNSGVFYLIVFKNIT